MAEEADEAGEFLEPPGGRTPPVNRLQVAADPIYFSL